MTAPDHVEQAGIKQGLGSHQKVGDCRAWFGEGHGDVENLDNVNEEVEEDGLEEDQKAPWE